MLLLWFSLLLVLLRKGDAQADCDASERTILKCLFSRNVNTTQADFSVYFQFDNGNEEMLVDCVWLSHKLQCLKQEGFNVKRQVSETAEITLPTRFVRANGTYTCNLEGLEKEQGTPCRSDEKQEEIQSKMFNGSIHENHLNDTEAENNISWIAGGVSGAAIAICIVGLIILVIYRHVKKTPGNTAFKPDSSEEDIHSSKGLGDENSRGGDHFQIENDKTVLSIP